MENKESLVEALSSIVKQRQSFNGFNLVVGSFESENFLYFCNADSSPFIFEKTEESKEEGVRVFAVSNGHALKGKYPKMEIYSYRIK